MSSVTHLQRCFMQFVIGLVMFAPFCCIAAEAVQDPVIVDVVVVSSNSDLLLFASAKNCFTQEMLEGVHNAIPVTFRFDVDLYRSRRHWPDDILVEQDISRTLSYDPIKQEYQVSFSEKEQPQTTRTLKEAKQMMTELSGIKIIERKKLIPDATYALHLKATLAENALPAAIRSMIPFVSLWNFETDWRIVEFRY